MISHISPNVSTDVRGMLESLDSSAAVFSSTSPGCCTGCALHLLLLAGGIAACTAGGIAAGTAAVGIAAVASSSFAVAAAMAAVASSFAAARTHFEADFAYSFAGCRCSW